MYGMTSVGAGRHAAWSMVDPNDGILKHVVAFHSTSRAPEPSLYATRIIFNIDRTFGSQEEASAHFAENILRRNPASLDSLSSTSDNSAKYS